jgi:hypothetical protein
MKKLLIAALAAAALSFPTLAKARIGWTLEQCKEHYGKVLSEKPVEETLHELGYQSGPMKYTFKVGETNIEVRIHGGVVYNIHYTLDPTLRSEPSMTLCRFYAKTATALFGNSTDK